MPYAVEFIHSTQLKTGADPEDLAWHRMLQRFDTIEQANDEKGWLELDDDGFAYRVREVAA
jgi:hypothetical protein